MTDATREFRIRGARLEDAALLSALAARSFYDTYAVHNRPEDMAAYMAAEFGPAIQAAQISDPRTRTLVAESASHSLIAYVQLFRAETPRCVAGPQPVEIRRLYVDKPWIGRGVAQQMMAAAYEVARAWGGQSIWLGVWERNPRAVAFYRKCGFKHVGEVPFQFAADAQTDMVMERALPAG